MARPKSSNLSTPVAIQLTKQQHEKLRKIASQTDTSIASLIRKAVEVYYITK